MESRPLSQSIRLQKPWEYVVYIDVDMGTNEHSFENAIRNLQEFSKVEIFGSYPRYLKPAEHYAAIAFAYGN
jgi:prephenate dehydratase